MIFLTIFGNVCLSGCVRIVFKQEWRSHECLKTNSEMSAEARVAKDSDGKPYTHSCCSWKVIYIKGVIQIADNADHPQ